MERVKIENVNREMYRDLKSKSVSIPVSDDEIDSYYAKKKKITDQREREERTESRLNSLEEKIDLLIKLLAEK